MIATILDRPSPPAARLIAERLAARFPGAAVLLYGSGISLSAGEEPTEIMFDYYVITPSYADSFASRAERLAAWLIPPNVYCFQEQTDYGVLRAKYAVLSIAHLEKLVSRRTFHSYFWGRFAQPMRLVAAPDALRTRVAAAAAAAVTTFCARAQPLADDQADWRQIWVRGMTASYRSELRAENGERAAKLVEHFADWAGQATPLALAGREGKTARWAAALAWRARAVQGAVLSVARLIKGTFTFDGGVDYIAWKIQRHTGVDLNVKDWERRYPVFALPFLSVRYFRRRSAIRAVAGDSASK